MEQMLSVENAQALVNDYAVPWGINIAMALAILLSAAWLSS